MEQQEGVPPQEIERFGRLVARYGYVPRAAGQLAIGELVREPHLGIARVAGVNVPEPDAPFVHIEWVDDLSWSAATVRYPADRALPVRVPSPGNRLSIQQGVDRAARINREIVPDIARLIAAHLHHGQRSAVYRFAKDGAIRDVLFDELDTVSKHQSHYRPWVNALARFALSREDTYPVPGWQAGDGTEIAASNEANGAMTGLPLNGKRRSASKPKTTSANSHHPAAALEAMMTTDIDAKTKELIQEAFLLGVQSASKAGAARARRIVKAWEQMESRVT